MWLITVGGMGGATIQPDLDAAGPRLKDGAAVVVACADPDMTHKTTFSPDYLHTMHSVVELAQQQITSGGAGEN